MIWMDVTHRLNERSGGVEQVIKRVCKVLLLYSCMLVI